ncbi:MAG: sortase [Candidatus Kaiserbacteria bacterium]|nr:sortase [Candidatus Kaiserbacteria bacterium]
MEEITTIAVWLIGVGTRIYARKGIFIGIFAFVFLGNVFLLSQFGLLPTPEVSAATSVTAVADPLIMTKVAKAAPEIPAVPLKIEIPAIALSATIENPTTHDIETLDQELLSGAVRYPTSAKLGETGNVVLFGHSSYLPIVHNQAYKTFNGIQKLSKGDTIIVYSAERVYTYQMRSFAKENATDASIPLVVTGRVLTLSTCDSFGAKTDRFVVVADFVESHSSSN